MFEEVKFQKKSKTILWWGWRKLNCITVPRHNPVNMWERIKKLKKLSKQMESRCRNCFAGRVRQREAEKKMITEQESRDKWERMLSSDAACFDLTVSVYVGSLNVVFLPGGNGQRESVSWLGQGWVWLSKEWSGRRKTREKGGECETQELKKLPKTHKDKEKRGEKLYSSVFNFLHHYAVLQKQCCLWLKWLWQLCFRQSTDIATRQSRRNLEDRVKDLEYKMGYLVWGVWNFRTCPD